MTNAQQDVLNTNSANQLRSILDRIERVEEEMDGLKEDRKEIYSEAKGNGFDVKILRRIVRIRKQDRAKRMEEESILELYMSALGLN